MKYEGDLLTQDQLSDFQKLLKSLEFSEIPNIEKWYRSHWTQYILVISLLSGDCHPYEVAI